MDKDDQPFRKAASDAQAHLLELLHARGHTCEVIHGNVIVKKATDGLEVEIQASIWPHFPGYSRTPDGVSIKINKRGRSVNYWKKGTDITAFDWDRLVGIIEEDLDYRLRERAANRREENRRENNARLAQLEVPLPLKKRYFVEEPCLDGFERTRSDDGLYRLRIDLSGFTKEEACAMRDLVTARHQRLNNHEEKTNQEAPAASR